MTCQARHRGGSKIGSGGQGREVARGISVAPLFAGQRRRGNLERDGKRSQHWLA